MILTVIRREDTLLVQQGDGPEQSTLPPESPVKFAVVGTDLTVTFMVNRAGRSSES